MFFAFLGLAVCRKAKAPLIGDIDACEIFAGVGSVTSALKASTVKKKSQFLQVHDHVLILLMGFHNRVQFRVVKDLGYSVALADIEMGQCFDVTTSAGFLFLGRRPSFSTCLFHHCPTEQVRFSL